MSLDLKETLPMDVERGARFGDIKLEIPFDSDRSPRDASSAQPAESELEPQPQPPAAVSPDADFKEGGLKGWLIVVGCWCVMFFTFGFLNAFGIYEAYYLQTFMKNHPASDVAWIGSIQLFFLFSGGFVSGPICDKFGPQVIIYPFCALFVISLMLTSLCTRYYEFMLCQGVLGGLSMGLAYQPAIAVVGHYFRHKRPVAIGIAASGSSLGGILLPIMLNRMLNHTTLGFGWSQRIVGFVVLVLAIVAVITIRPGVAPRSGSHLLPQAFEKPEYTFQIIGLFLIVWGVFIPFFYLPTYAEAHGMSINMSWYLVSIMNTGSMFGRLISGYVAVAVGPFSLLSACCTIYGVLALCWLRATSNAALIVLGVLFGFFSGGIIGLMLSTISHVAPRPNEIGTYMGMASGIFSIAGLTGPPITGVLISHDHSFTQAIIWSGVTCLAGSGFICCAWLAILRAGKTKS